MTVENDFLPFAVGAGANVLTQAQYAALSAVASGYSAGVAQSAAINKTLRQSSIMAAVLAQFIVQRTGENVIDDGTTATILANLLASAAALNGDSTKTFSVAPATASQHAVQLGQLESTASPLPLATSPSTSANQAVNQGQVFGVGQSFTNVGASRSFGATFANTTGKPISVYIQGAAGGASGAMTLVINGITCAVCVYSASGSVLGVNGVVPAGANYAIATSGGGATMAAWYEMR